MNPQPRYYAEYFILRFRRELQNYSEVFHARVSKAFENLDSEAERVQEEEYERLGQSCDPENADPGRAAEQAYEAGVEFYLAIDAVRQGVFNLMIAGLFHSLEQQAQYLVTHVLSPSGTAPSRDGGFNQLKRVLTDEFRINPEAFQCWPLLSELQLVANVVKHAGGGSLEKLKGLNPALFNDPVSGLTSHMPVRPLVGDGLRLTADQFDAYKACVDQFWQELADALAPHFNPS